MEREQLEMDVVFVGAGPGNLSAALHLTNLIKKHNETGKGKKIGELEIGIIEKGAAVGAHVLSGAVIDPRALQELMPDFLEQGCPIEAEVTDEDFFYLTESRGQSNRKAFPRPEIQGKH